MLRCVPIRAPVCPSGRTLNRSTSFLIRRGYLDPSYVFASLTDRSASFYPLAMAFVLPRDLISSAKLENWSVHEGRDLLRGACHVES
jgi:hypothetical protein